jgi:hypothetical protein
LLLILHGLSGLRVKAQSQSAEQEAYAALRAVESKTDRCWPEREAMARERDNERIRIPSYTAELSKVIYDFHRHTSDMQLRDLQALPSICKEDDLSEKIDSAMK